MAGVFWNAPEGQASRTVSTFPAATHHRKNQGYPVRFILRRIPCFCHLTLIRRRVSRQSNSPIWYLIFTSSVSTMKASHLYWVVSFCVSFLLTAQDTSQFQYITNNDSTITLTKFTGSNGWIVIPDTINGHTVTEIGDSAFYSSGVGSVSIPDTITSIGNSAFAECGGLYRVIIPRTVTSIGNGAFFGCNQLAEVYFFEGWPVSVGLFAFNVQPGIMRAKFYYLPGTPVISQGSGQFSGKPAAFQFTVSWISDQHVVIEMATNWARPKWQPVSTNIISSGVFQFVDTDATQHPTRLYRVRPR